MAYDLNELHERIDWCRQKTATLEAEIIKVAGQSIKHWLFPWGPGTGEIKAHMLSPPPVSLRADVGMIVNEQRAVLDALACTLATRAGANHTNDVYFPITRDKQGYDELGRKKIRKLSQADRDAIEALTPWAPDDEGANGHPWLFKLHEADRVRKHQKLLKWACLGGVHPAGNGHIGQMQTGPVVFTEIGKEETLAFFRNVTCSLAVHFSLIYVEPAALDGWDVAGCLQAFNETIDEIVTAFD